MAEDRLTLLAPGLSEKLKRAEPASLRKVLLAACRFALDRAQFSHPTIDQALLSLENGKPLDPSSLQKIRTLASSLDNKYFDLDAAWQEDSTVDRTPALAAFRQARAANAVWFAAQDNGMESAPECLYEANAAAEDLEALKEIAAVYIV